jgi:hypothetical protein
MLCGCDGGASGDQRWIHLCPLHAAAPDLLAALENLLSEAEALDSQIHDEWGVGAWPRGDDVKEIVDARAAIAKTKDLSPVSGVTESPKMA